MNILVNLKKTKTVFFVLIFFTNRFCAFDVKVLLQRYNFNVQGQVDSKNQKELKSSIDLKNPTYFELSAQDGFILSYNPVFSTGCSYPHKILKISSKDDRVFVNGKTLDQKILYITPMLSHAAQLELKSHISCWLESSGADFLSMTKGLQSVFENILNSDNPLSDENCNSLMNYILTVFEQYFNELVAKHEEVEEYLEIIEKYAHDYLQIQFRKVFAEILENKHITPEYRKILVKDHKKLQTFFNEQLFDATEKLLIEFVYALPKKIVQTMLEPQISMIEYNGQKYLGTFIIFQDKKQFFLINSLDINDYLLSVVRHEGFPGWPIEMNKVTAIACRTYLVYQILQAQKLDRAYHIENKNNHQTYKGYFDCPKIRQAIEETKDVIIGFNGYPICSMYDVCCGGVVPGSIDDPDHKKIPYLARSYPCTFCKSYKPYRWTLDFSSEEILKRLTKEFPKIEKITDIEIYKKDKAGLVKKVMIFSGNRKIIITEKKMKMLFPEMKSYCFDITKAHKRYLIEGKGFGHHKGLCQWGACHLVRHEHWNFQQVLQFYYPGTTLMKLSY
jgi:stage II sporulation protein D